MKLQIIGAIAVIAGIGLELLDVDGEQSLGTAIAAIGLVVAVYAIVTRREQQKLEKQLDARRDAPETRKTR
jgi:hypothetical protein